MRKYLLMSHGLMASGIQNTLTMLIGEPKNLTVISAYINEETNIEQEISQILNTLSSKDELIIFTDILGGSINNNAMLFIKNPKVHLITGINIAIIAEIINNDDNKSPLKEIIESAILLGREALVYCNTQNQNIADDEF